MAIEKVKEILEKIINDPKAQELFNGLKQPESEEEKAVKMIEVAKQLGYDLKAEDLKEYLKDAVAARKEKTEAQADAIQKLDDSELETAAGGGGNPDCKYTYRDEENCWWNDACDLNHRMYASYICSHNHNNKVCSLLDMVKCQELYF